MIVINMNTHPVSVKIAGPNGPDFVHLVARGRVELGDDSTVDSNWLAVTPNIKTFSTPVPAPAQPAPKAE